MGQHTKPQEDGTVATVGKVKPLATRKAVAKATGKETTDEDTANASATGLYQKDGRKAACQ